MAFELLSPRTEFLVLALCYRLLLSTQVKAKVPAIYVFGDSLADVGNNDYLPFTIMKANFEHYGVDYPGRKATGRFSKGKNGAEFLGTYAFLQQSVKFVNYFHLVQIFSHPVRICSILTAPSLGNTVIFRA